MKLLLKIFILTLSGGFIGDATWAQSVEAPTFNYEKFISDRMSMSQLNRKSRKYNRNIYLYMVKVKLKQGEEIDVNSVIFKDRSSNTCFLYYSTENETFKIYPEQTSEIMIRDPSNPESRKLLIGVASEHGWRFELVAGKISLYSYVIQNSTRYDEMRLPGGGIIPFNPDLLLPVIRDNKEAYDAFLDKDYYSAVKIYNKKG